MKAKPGTIKEAIKGLREAQKRYEKLLAIFQERFAQSPVNAFTWAEEAVTASVRLPEINLLIEQFQNRAPDDARSDDEVIAFLAGYYRDRAISSAQGISRTSSPLNALVDRNIVAFHAALFAWFSGHGSATL